MELDIQQVIERLSVEIGKLTARAVIAETARDEALAQLQKAQPDTAPGEDGTPA